MMIKLTCPSCNQDFGVKIETLEDTYDTTMDCPNESCQELLYSHHERGIIPMHKYLHEKTNGKWDKDGKNTGFIDMEAD